MQQLLHRGAAITQHRTDDIPDASWDDLKSFLACARHKSFRHAADLLGELPTEVAESLLALVEVAKIIPSLTEFTFGNARIALPPGVPSGPVQVTMLVERPAE